MPEGTARLLGRLRNREHTGAQRCRPCTALNVALVLAIAVVVARASRAGSAAVLGLGVAVVYLRGYLVPGTPALTRWLLPERVHRRLGHGGAGGRGADREWETVARAAREREAQVEAVPYLESADVLRPVEDGAYRLTEAFATRVQDALDRLGSDPIGPARVAILLRGDDSAPEPDAVEPVDRPYPAFRVGHRIRSWPSSAALRADVTLHDALAETTAGGDGGGATGTDGTNTEWTAVPLEQRLRILAVLRTYLSRCPACSGGLAVSDGTVDSCCRAVQVRTLSCVDCDQRLLEVQPRRDAGPLSATDLPPGPQLR